MKAIADGAHCLTSERKCHQHERELTVVWLFVHSTCCPYPLVAIPGILSYAALIITWIAALSCDFFITTYIGDPLHVGLWTVESFDTYGEFLYESSTCNGYGWRDSNIYGELDGAMRTARAFSLIAGILGVVVFVLILVPSCVAFDDSANKNRYLLILCGLSIFTGIATFLDLVSTRCPGLADFLAGVDSLILLCFCCCVG